MEIDAKWNSASRSPKNIFCMYIGRILGVYSQGTSPQRDQREIPDPFTSAPVLLMEIYLVHNMTVTCRLPKVKLLKKTELKSPVSHHFINIKILITSQGWLRKPPATTSLVFIILPLLVLAGINYELA